MLSSVGLKNKSHIFLIWKGERGWGGGGEILRIKNAGEAISGHFVRTILPSVNEFQKILLPFIVCSFLNIEFRQICVCISLGV